MPPLPPLPPRPPDKRALEQRENTTAASARALVFLANAILARSGAPEWAFEQKHIRPGGNYMGPPDGVKNAAREVARRGRLGWGLTGPGAGHG